MQLVSEASQWHRLWSMRFLILTTAYSAAAGAWAVLPPDLKPDLGNTAKLVLAGVGVLLPALAAVARLVDQPALRPDDTDQAGA